MNKRKSISSGYIIPRIIFKAQNNVKTAVLAHITQKHPNYKKTPKLHKDTQTTREPRILDTQDDPVAYRTPRLPRHPDYPDTQTTQDPQAGPQPDLRNTIPGHLWPDLRF